MNETQELRQAKGEPDTSDRPTVLFACVHNAGRSQMAAAYAHQLSGGRVEVLSAGSEPAKSINSLVRDALLEDGIDISAETPKLLTPEAVKASDVVITMGCGETCPIFPGKRYEDWEVADPAGQDLASVREIRDDVKKRVEDLLTSLDVSVQP
ncbi:arsenate reductase ArsC [Cutibacterium equinum]|uniref:Arsenate reductase ArsC n=1 Tax=Cutibacterium equinum TaxID=3016342 RepID=A0ABY7QVM1_9ACTN|nr:arsenate reductase ArsC [Cutibacterium equinum]WCC79119.1 arsenate reductase ArsC [Cutibacterium equinum]